MQREKLIWRTAHWARHSLRLLPRLVRLRHQKRTGAPTPPQSPYRRFYTKNRSFAQLTRRR